MQALHRSLFFVAAVLCAVAILVLEPIFRNRSFQRFPPWRNSSNRPVTGIIALGGSFNGLGSLSERFGPLFAWKNFS